MINDHSIAHHSAKQLIVEMYNNNYSTKIIAELSRLSTTTIQRLYRNDQQHITPKTFYRLLQAYCKTQMNPSPSYA